MEFNIRVRLLSGEMLAEFKCTPRESVDGLLHRLAAKDRKEAALSRYSLLLNDRILNAEVVMGDLSLDAAGWTELQCSKMVRSISTIHGGVSDSPEIADWHAFKVLITGHPTVLDLVTTAQFSQAVRVDGEQHVRLNYFVTQSVRIDSNVLVDVDAVVVLFDL